MFYHLVLGCLRDGTSRHGYDVWAELNARCGLRVNAGNVYRELAKLVTMKLIDAVERPSEVDPRRNPYAITDAGRRTFDEWFLSPITQDDEFAAWLSFIDRVPREELPAILDRLQERLWLKAKTLTQAREDALSRARANGNKAVAELTALQSLLEVKQATVTLEFVEELRRNVAVLPARAEEPRSARTGKAPRSVQR
jgi:DNA-binding PadR family transcriptional regulator